MSLSQWRTFLLALQEVGQTRPTCASKLYAWWSERATPIWLSRGKLLDEYASAVDEVVREHFFSAVEGSSANLASFQYEEWKEDKDDNGKTKIRKNARALIILRLRFMPRS